MKGQQRIFIDNISTVHSFSCWTLTMIACLTTENASLTFHLLGLSKTVIPFFHWAFIYSTHALTSNQFWVGPQAPQPFIVYQPTCTTLGLTHARTQANRVSGVDSTRLWGAYPGGLSGAHWLIVLPSVPMSHPWNKHQTPCKPCTIKQDTWTTLAPQGHYVPQLYHKIAPPPLPLFLCSAQCTCSAM